MAKILEVSIRLFLENGYRGTTARQISATAGLSLGLMNHYFSSKADLAATVLRIIARQVILVTEPYIDVALDPLFADTLITRALNEFLLGTRWRQFYIESIEEDVFFRALAQSNLTLITAEMNKYGIELTEDLLSLYGRYAPYNMEKTLVLGKEQGMFPNITYDDIPDYITSASVEKFLPAQDIEEATKRARLYTKRIIKQMPLIPTCVDECILAIQNPNQEVLMPF
jgi:AcrR family transcriptional regulator